MTVLENCKSSCNVQSVVRDAFAEAAQRTQGDFVLQQGIHPAATIASEEAHTETGGPGDTWGTL